MENKIFEIKYDEFDKLYVIHYNPNINQIAMRNFKQFLDGFKEDLFEILVNDYNGEVKNGTIGFKVESDAERVIEWLEAAYIAYKLTKQPEFFKLEKGIHINEYPGVNFIHLNAIIKA